MHAFMYVCMYVYLRLCIRYVFMLVIDYLTFVFTSNFFFIVCE